MTSKFQNQFFDQCIAFRKSWDEHRPLSIFDKTEHHSAKVLIVGHMRDSYGTILLGPSQRRRTVDRHEGMELPSRETVTWQVTRILVDVARDEMPTEDRAIISVKVRNEASEVISVATLTFASEWFG
jgi:hypothetical protein